MTQNSQCRVFTRNAPNPAENYKSKRRRRRRRRRRRKNGAGASARGGNLASREDGVFGRRRRRRRRRRRSKRTNHSLMPPAAASIHAVPERITRCPRCSPSPLSWRRAQSQFSVHGYVHGTMDRRSPRARWRRCCDRLDRLLQSSTRCAEPATCSARSDGGYARLESPLEE